MEKRKQNQTKVNESSSLISLSHGTPVSLQVLAVSSDVLHHTILPCQLVVSGEVTNHPVGGKSRSPIPPFPILHAAVLDSYWSSASLKPLSTLNMDLAVYTLQK